MRSAVAIFAGTALTLLLSALVDASAPTKPRSFRMPMSVFRSSHHYSRRTGGSDEDEGAQGNQDDMAVSGADLAYSGIIGIGQDPQWLNLQLDTGSSLMAVFSTEFEAHYPNSGNGVKRGPPFDRTKSNTTDIPGMPEILYRYADKTYFNATMVQDKVVVAGYVMSDAPFGLMTSGNFSTPGDSISGILGLGWSSMNKGNKLSRSNTTPIVEQLWRDGVLEEPLFTFNLFRNKLDSGVNHSTSDADGGVFTLGKLDTDLYDGDIAWKPLNYDPRYSRDRPSTWSASIDFLTVNGVKLQGSEGLNAGFDTGSAGWILPADLIQAIYANTPNTIINNAGTFTKCGMPGESSPLNLTVTFGGVDFPVDFEDLVYERIKTSDGVIACRSFLQPGNALLGAVFLKNVFSAFRFEPPSIGFAKISSMMAEENKPEHATASIGDFVGDWGPVTPLSSPTISEHHYETLQTITATKTEDLIQTVSFSLQTPPSFLGTTEVGTVTGTGLQPSPTSTSSTDQPGPSSTSSTDQPDSTSTSTSSADSPLATGPLAEREVGDIFDPLKRADDLKVRATVECSSSSLPSSSLSNSTGSGSDSAVGPGSNSSSSSSSESASGSSGSSLSNSTAGSNSSSSSSSSTVSGSHSAAGSSNSSSSHDIMVDIGIGDLFSLLGVPFDPSLLNSTNCTSNNGSEESGCGGGGGDGTVSINAQVLADLLA